MYKKAIFLLVIALICAFVKVKASNYISCAKSSSNTQGMYWTKAYNQFQHPTVVCGDRLSDAGDAERSHRYQLLEGRPSEGKTVILCPSPYTYIGEIGIFMKMEENGQISCAAESIKNGNTHFKIIDTGVYNEFILRCPNGKYVEIYEIEYIGRAGPYKRQVLSCSKKNKKTAAVFIKEENRSP